MKITLIQFVNQKSKEKRESHSFFILVTFGLLDNNAKISTKSFKFTYKTHETQF